MGLVNLRPPEVCRLEARIDQSDVVRPVTENRAARDESYAVAPDGRPRTPGTHVKNRHCPRLDLPLELRIREAQASDDQDDEHERGADDPRPEFGPAAEDQQDDAQASPHPR